MKSIIFIVMLFSFRSFAEEVKMVTIQSDIDSSQTAVMSIQTLEDKSIENILYHLGENKKVFSVEKLNESEEALIKKGPVDILEISTESLSENNVVLSIKYLYNFSLFGSDRRTKKLQMRYVSPSNQYETIDLDTQKTIQNAFAYVRYVDGKAKGIDRIETW